MQIKEIFSRPIQREIKEVIKVDDRGAIMDEIEEYHPTKHIAEELVDVLEVFQATINSPSEEINIWVSGFFGSGKSSFAKVLGYLLSNPVLDGSSVVDRFFALNDIPEAKALLATIHTLAPTESVFLDLNTSPNVLQEGEPIVLPIYRTLLGEFGYSRDVTLAELEFYLEGRDQLDSFRGAFEAIYDHTWESQRDINLAKNPASRVLHELDGATYPSADSYSNSAEMPTVTAKWFAKRALEMMRRRHPDKKRLVLIVDEVGQYVSRSTDRMRHLQGLAEECQKTKGALWLVATSQEKLTDMVDSLEGKQTELAKAQDRFPIRVDLLPSDIDEVTGKRILSKTAKGAVKVRELLDADRNKFLISVNLQSARHQPFSDEDFVRLYPLVPYQLEVLIDAVDARRRQGRMPRTMGGSARTLVSHAQQLLSNDHVGLAENSVGDLVTLDRSYHLLEDVIPTAWRREVDKVAEKYGSGSLEAQAIRVIALCTGIPGVPLSQRNLAVMLHPSISADPIVDEVGLALRNLVTMQSVFEGDGGFELQSPDRRTWEEERKAIDMKPGDAIRLRKRILKDAIGSMTVTKSRTFKIELYAEREKVSDGDIALDIRDEDDLESLRRNSRADDAKNRIFWAYSTTDQTWDALTELHRSTEMIERYDNAGQTDPQRGLIAEERKRRDRSLKAAEQLLSRDVTSGKTIFDGNSEDAPSGELRSSATQLVSGLLDKIYPNLDTFAGAFKKAEVLQILQADTLDGLPPHCGPEGLGLFRTTAAGRELVTDSGPIATVMAHIEARKQYGEDQNGGQLERYFGAPPFGAPVESLQAVLAAALRAGLIEVVSQAARISSATDRRIEQVFGNIPKFRSASFGPAKDVGPPVEVRAEVSEWLHTITGNPVGLDLHELAASGRATFGPLRQPCTEARSTLIGAGLAVPDDLSTMDEVLGRLASADDELVVATMHERRADLDAGRRTVAELAQLVDNEMPTLRSAVMAIPTAGNLLEPKASDWAKTLQDLVDRARYRDDLAQIKSLTTSIEKATAEEEASLRADLTDAVEMAAATLRTRYASVDDAIFDDAIRPLLGLVEASGLPLLRANSHAVGGVFMQIAAAFDAILTTRQVRHIRVADIWASPITSPDDLESALSRLREAVLAQLDDDTEIRFR